MRVMKIYISHSSSYDYENELYAPIKASELYKEHKIFLPHGPKNIDIPAKDVLAKMDLLIAEVSYPSTGQGIEMGLASAANVPIICFFKDGSKPSSSLRFITEKIFKYHNTNDLLGQLKAQLS